MSWDDFIAEDHICDPSPQVRGEVAERINPDRLPEMMGDEWWVVRRIDPSRLPEMMCDSNRAVLYMVACDISPQYLSAMLLREL